MDIKDIPLEDILEPEVIIRTTADDEKIAELVESIRENDLIHPLTVRLEGDKYRLIAGWRRRLACIALGWETVPCNVKEVGPAEGALLLLAENLGREDIDPIDEAKYFQYLVASLNLTHEQIANRIGKHRVYVTKRIALLRLDPETQHDITYSGLAPTTALEIGRVPEKSSRDYIRNTAVKHGASTAIVRSWVEDAIRRPNEVDAGDIVPGDDWEPPKSTYQPPTCFVCGRSLDEGGLQNVWICGWELDAIKKSMEEGE